MKAPLLRFLFLSALLFACDERRVRQDFDESEDLTRLGAGGAEAGALEGEGDSKPADGTRLQPRDAASSMETDGVGLPDLEPTFDATGHDGPHDGLAAADALNDLGFLADQAPSADQGRAVDANQHADRPTDLPAEVQLFIAGTAHAADERGSVSVHLDDLSAMTDQDGHFRLGPIAPGRALTLIFRSPHHQEEQVLIDAPADAPDGEVQLGEDVLLYRGRRVSGVRPERLLFAGRDAYLAWDDQGVLSALPLQGAFDPRIVVPADFEVLLGLTPDELGFVVRRHNRPGLAGDIDIFPADGGPRQPLFEEAQPWVRWIGDSVLGMTHTREALSTLQLRRPLQRVLTLAEGVPWLLVAVLDDASIAYAAGGPPSFDVFIRSSVDDGPAEPITLANTGTSDGFLATRRGNQGLFFLDADGVLYSHTRDGRGTVAVARDVLLDPRPTQRGEQSYVFTRADPEQPEARLLVEATVPDGEQVHQRGVLSTGLIQGRNHYFFRRGDAVLHARWAQPGLADRVAQGVALTTMPSGEGLFALGDGQAFAAQPSGDVVVRYGPLEVGLSELTFAPPGALVFKAESNEVIFLPTPGPDAARLSVITQAQGRATRLVDAANRAVYVRDDRGWQRFSLPPDGRRTALDRDPPTLTLVDAARVLGLDVELGRGLRQFDTGTGRSFGWANAVTGVYRSPAGGFAAYVSDRGVFVVPMADAN